MTAPLSGWAAALLRFAPGCVTPWVTARQAPARVQSGTADPPSVCERPRMQATCCCRSVERYRCSGMRWRLCRRTAPGRRLCDRRSQSGRSAFGAGHFDGRFTGDSGSRVRGQRSRFAAVPVPTREGATAVRHQRATRLVRVRVNVAAGGPVRIQAERVRIRARRALTVRPSSHCATRTTPAESTRPPRLHPSTHRHPRSLRPTAR